MLTKISKTQLTIIITLLIIVISGSIFTLQQNQNKSQEKEKLTNMSQNSNQKLSILSSNFTNFSQKDQNSETNSKTNPNSANSTLNSINSQNPTNLLVNSINTSINNQLKPLVADGEYDVVVMEECDLAVRFKKSIEEEKYKFNFDYSKNKEGVYYLQNMSKSMEDIFLIKCSSVKNYYEQDLSLIGKKGKDYLGSFRVNKPSTNFCWELSIKNTMCSKIEPLMQTESSDGIKGYYFKQNNIFYSIDIKNTGSSNLLDTFQFNSLAPSKPSVKL